VAQWGRLLLQRLRRCCLCFQVPSSDTVTTTHSAEGRRLSSTSTPSPSDYLGSLVGSLGFPSLPGVRPCKGEHLLRVRPFSAFVAFAESNHLSSSAGSIAREGPCKFAFREVRFSWKCLGRSNSKSRTCKPRQARAGNLVFQPDMESVVGKGGVGHIARRRLAASHVQPSRSSSSRSLPCRPAIWELQPVFAVPDAANPGHCRPFCRISRQAHDIANAAISKSAS
jgi:hypothetical protein